MKIRTLKELDELDKRYTDEPKTDKNWLKTFIYDEHVFTDDCLRNAYAEFFIAGHPGAEKFGKEILRRIIQRKQNETGD